MLENTSERQQGDTFDLSLFDVICDRVSLLDVSEPNTTLHHHLFSELFYCTAEVFVFPSLFMIMNVLSLSFSFYH
jgi:hypothetical protein